MSGEEIRDQAMNRPGGSSTEGRHRSTPRKRQSAADSDDDDNERMAEHVRRQHESSQKRFKIEQHRLKLEQDKAEREMEKAERESARDKIDMERASRMESLRERQLQLDPKRF